MTDDKSRKTPPPGNSQNRPGRKPPLPTYRRGPFTWLIIVLLVFTGYLIVQETRGIQKIRWDEFVSHVENKHIKTVTIKDAAISGEFNQAYLDEQEGSAKPAFSVDYKSEIDKDWLTELRKQMIADGVEIEAAPTRLWPYMLMNWLLPLIILIAVFYFLFARNMRGGAGGMLMSFGRSKHRIHSKDRAKVTFQDVAGVEEAKDELAEIIEFLKKPKKFQRLGGRIPRGVLLVGPPGCGKTLLAKAIAGEADVPFFSISGSDFVEMFVGVGASRVRDLFKQAKDNSPCIIFLDEVDAIGRKRGPGFVGGGHDEREQTLNAILVEMDGFETNDQVIVIAATNRADILDHALTRPGRFDRQVFVPLPDIKGRADILKVHAKKVKLSPDANIERLARGTPMFSGADLAAIINEAALAATMANKDCIETADLEEARDKVRWGRAKKSRVLDKKEKEITAYHEAGHTLVQSLLDEADPLHKVSIIPRGPMGGATFALPEKDRTLFTKKYCMAQLQVCFGGRIAEEMVFKDVSSGASYDIMQATSLAKQMALTWGMSSDLGPIRYGSEAGQNEYAYPMPGEKEYSEKTAEIIDKEVRKLIDEAFNNARELIQTNKDSLDKIAKALLKYETLDADDVKLLLDGGELDKPTVADLLAAEQAKDGESEAQSQEKGKDTQDSEPEDKEASD
ncbi:MAG: ATP-dependent zinc metalloprotease FtsH [Sedimentisphaerales bacterium]|nr:ATP-dependent zinc metalloprotease FtsH [Sedimentisphaerales bacterium]